MRIDRITRRSMLALALALPVAGCANPVQPDRHHPAAGLVVEDVQGALLARVEADRAVTGGITVRAGQEREVRVFFLDEAGRRIALDGRELSLRATVRDAGAATWAKLEEDRGRLSGGRPGSTVLVLEMMHGSHPDYRSPELPVTVAE